MPDWMPNMSETSRDHLADLAGLNTAHQAQAMEALMMDRCLLRRDMAAQQNKTYDLPQDKLPDCTEDDMGVQVGDNDNSKVVHNHYHNEQPTPPNPVQPRPRIPRWLIVLLVVPWIVLAIILLTWIFTTMPPDGGGGSDQPVIWQLRGAVDNPTAVPEPVTIQPTPRE